MEPHYWLQCSQEHSSGLRREPYEPRPTFRPIPSTVNFNITAPSTPRSDIKWFVQAVRQNIVHQGVVLRPSGFGENAGVNKNRYKK
jgi:hypothetical protein